MTLEDRIADDIFGLGLLLNLLQVRLDHQSRGLSLTAVVCRETPTSKVWLEKWVAEWSGAVKTIDNPSNDEDFIERAKELHKVWYHAGKRCIPEYIVESVTSLGQPRRNRWAKLGEIIEGAGRVGKILLKLGTFTSRQSGKESRCVWVTRVDFDRYESKFENHDIFGSVSAYGYPDGNVQA